MIRNDILVDAVCVRSESPSRTEFRLEFNDRSVKGRTTYTVVMTADQLASALTAKVVDGVTMEIRQRRVGDDIDRQRARNDVLERVLKEAIKFRSSLLKRYQSMPSIDGSEKWPPSIARDIIDFDAAINDAKRQTNE